MNIRTRHIAPLALAAALALGTAACNAEGTADQPAGTTDDGLGGAGAGGTDTGTTDDAATDDTTTEDTETD